jgi:hypothetical protein
LTHVELNQAIKDGDELFLVHLRLAHVEHTGADPEPEEEERTAPSPQPTSAWQRELDRVLSRYPVMNEDPVLTYPPERGVTHKIVLKSDKQPRQRGYRMSELERQALGEQLQDLLARGLIQPSKSPFTSPIIFVRKKDGSLRMCVDYRAINEITVKDRYPLPRIDELLDRLRGAKIFSKLDLASGYHQVRMDEASIPMTAFSCEKGLFEYRVMPFGLCNAPATFQSMMNEVLSGLEFALVYLDDVLIFSTGEAEHLRHLDTVCQRLQQQELYAQRAKCEFGTDRTEFLGHIVSAAGIECDPRKLAAITSWPEPKSPTEVAAFMGLVNFYRRFAKNLSGVAGPLTALLKKGAEFEWTPEAQLAFDSVKQLLTSAPILMPPDPTLPFTLYCDSSAFANGAVLTQGEGDAQRVVAFGSKKLNGAQTRYLNHDKELLSVVTYLQEWRHYLQNGQPIVVYTDNAATKYILSKDVEKLNNRQRNWLSILAEYCPELRHLPGTENVVADALSRRPHLTMIMWADLSADLFTSVREQAPHDADYQKLVQAVQEPSPATSGQAGAYLVREKLLYRKAGEKRDALDLLYIPSGEVRTRLLAQAHDVPESGHLGRDKTLERLQRHFYWPGMKMSVQRYCASCEACQLNKPSRRLPIGLLYPLDAPSFPWESMGMDFVMGLPKTKNGYTAIVTFVDRLTKMVHLWPCTDAVTAEETMEIFLKAVWRIHGVPKEIVSDRDPRFVSDFWQALHKRLGTRFNMSTANHPQTDGQAERANGLIEEVLRSYVNIHQNDWDEHLPTVEYAANDSVQASTGVTAFKAIYGRDLISPLALMAQPPPPEGDAVARRRHESIRAFSARMAAQYKDIQASIRAAQERQKKYANEKRRDVEFKVGDQVLLRADHLRDRNLAEGATRKLSSKKEGPFRVKRVISRRVCELDLPAGGGYGHMHPAINVDRLEEYVDPAQPEFPGRVVRTPAPTLVREQQSHYQIDCFTKHRWRHGKLQFLVQWLGYSAAENTWQPATQLKEDMGEWYEKTKQQFEDRVLGGPVGDPPVPAPRVRAQAPPHAAAPAPPPTVARVSRAAETKRSLPAAGAAGAAGAGAGAKEPQPAEIEVSPDAVALRRSGRVATKTVRFAANLVTVHRY